MVLFAIKPGFSFPTGPQLWTNPYSLLWKNMPLGPDPRSRRSNMIKL